jgi:hypothetical protein
VSKNVRLDMVQSHHKRSRKMLRLGLFAFAGCLGVLGCIVAVDSLLPKERPVSAWAPAVEFLFGVMFLTLAVYVGRRSRLNWKTDEQASKKPNEGVRP